MYTLQLQLKLISCRSVCYKLSWLLKWNYSCIFLCCCLIPSHHVCVTGIVFLPDSISYLIASNACGHLIQQNSGRCVDRAKKLRGLSEFVQRKEAEILYWDPLEWCFERSKWLFFFFFKISVFIYLSSKSVWVISLWFLYQIYQEDNAVPVYTTLISSHRWLFACIGMTVAGITTISVSPKVYIKSKTLD